MPFVGVKKTLGNGILQHQDEDQVWWKRNQGSSLSRRFPRQPDIDIDAGFKNSNDSRGFLVYKARHWEHPKMYPPKLMMMRMMIKMMITLPPRREGSMCFQQDRPQALVATRTPRTWRDLKIIGNFMSCAKPHSYLTRTISFLQVRKLNLDWFGASLLSILTCWTPLALHSRGARLRGGPRLLLLWHNKRYKKKRRRVLLCKEISILWRKCWPLVADHHSR